MLFLGKIQYFCPHQRRRKISGAKKWKWKKKKIKKFCASSTRKTDFFWTSFSLFWIKAFFARWSRWSFELFLARGHGKFGANFSGIFRIKKTKNSIFRFFEKKPKNQIFRKNFFLSNPGKKHRGWSIKKKKIPSFSKICDFFRFLRFLTFFRFLSIFVKNDNFGIFF